MKNLNLATRNRRLLLPPDDQLGIELEQRVIGQPSALREIVPYVRMFEAGLAPEGRPVGVFLSLGPTGTGKTRTVEALAEVIHGSEKNVLKIDCGEFQMEHEVAKLIGAPPGYLGHRETQPLVSQQRLNSVTSDRSRLSVVLFDEIEKAAPSLSRLLLGILDKGTLRLGDNTTVNFEHSLIFLTSNLGAQAMMKEIRPDFGFRASMAPDPAELTRKIESIGMSAVRRKFSPEFVNRIDVVATYRPLSPEDFAAILNLELRRAQQHLDRRLRDRSFTLDVCPTAREFLLQKGTSVEFGARELKRTIHRQLLQPLSALVAAGRIPHGARLRVEPDPDTGKLGFRVLTAHEPLAHRRSCFLLLGDNPDLLALLSSLLEENHFHSLIVDSREKARALLAEGEADAILTDTIVSGGLGLELAAQMRKNFPQIHAFTMLPRRPTAQEELLSRRYSVTLLTKPVTVRALLQAYAASARDNNPLAA